MIIEFHDERDLDLLEKCMAALLTATRHDISLLKSSSYIEFKLKCLKNSIEVHDSVYFFNENLWIKVLEKQPIVLLYCGLKELEYDNINFTVDSISS